MFFYVGEKLRFEIRECLAYLLRQSICYLPFSSTLSLSAKQYMYIFVIIIIIIIIIFIFYFWYRTVWCWYRKDLPAGRPTTGTALY